MDRHPLDLEPFPGSLEPISRCPARPVCPAEAALCLAVIVLVLAVAGPSQIAAGAGAFVGTLVEMVESVFDAGGFLRPSW